MDKRSWDFDWARLGKAYHTAHELALARFRAEREVVVNTSPSAGGTLGGVAMVSADDLVKGNASRGVVGMSREEAKAEPKPPPRLESKPESRAESKPDAKAEIKPARARGGLP